MNITLHFYVVFSQPRINRDYTPQTVSCKLPCYFSRLQMMEKSRGKQRHYRLTRCWNIIKIDHTENYCENGKWKYLRVMALWMCWYLLIGPWWVGLLFVCCRKSIDYVTTFGFRRSIIFCWKLLSDQGRSVQWISFHLHLMLLMVNVNWAIYSGWCMVEPIPRYAYTCCE
jgi:hypothetical protein